MATMSAMGRTATDDAVDDDVADVDDAMQPTKAAPSTWERARRKSGGTLIEQRLLQCAPEKLHLETLRKPTVLDRF